MSKSELMRDFLAAMSRRDPAALEAMLAPDVVFMFPKTRPWEGREAFLKFIRILWSKYGELVFDPISYVVEGDAGCVHWRNSGRRADGSEYANEGITLCRFEGDRFTWLSDFFKDTEIF